MSNTMLIIHCLTVAVIKVILGRISFRALSAASALERRCWARSAAWALVVTMLHPGLAIANPWAATLDWRPGAAMKVLATSEGEKVGRTAGDVSNWPHIVTLSREAAPDVAGWRFEVEHQRYAKGVDWLAPVGIGPLRAYLPIKSGEQIALDRFDWRPLWAFRPVVAGGVAWRMAAGLNLGLLHLKYSGQELTTRGASTTWAPALRLQARRPLDEHHALIGDWQWSRMASGRAIGNGHRALRWGIERRLGSGQWLRLLLASRHDEVVFRGQQDLVRFEQAGFGLQIGLVFGAGPRETRGE